MKDGPTNWLRLVKSLQPIRVFSPEEVVREALLRGATVIVCVVMTKQGKRQARPMDVGIMVENPHLMALAWETEQQRHEGTQPPEWYLLKWKEKRN